MASIQSSSSSAFPQKTLPFGRRAHQRRQQFILSRILPRETEGLQEILLDLDLAFERGNDGTLKIASLDHLNRALLNAHKALQPVENRGAA